MSSDLRPFTLPHFRWWTSKLWLDTGEPWVLEPFQAAFARDLFLGRPENWFILPEGSAKTTNWGGIALYHARYRRDASVPVAASSRDQAEIMFRQMDGFIARSEDAGDGHLAGFRCQEGYRRIRYDEGRSRIQIFAADDRTGDGVLPTLALIDELHRQRDMRLYRTWRGKLDKRGGQLGVGSTAGEPGSEFEQTRERIRQDTNAQVTRKGSFVRVITPSLVLHEWAVPEGADVEDIRIVKRANPLKAMTTDKLRAKLESPTMTLTHWRRFVCNLPTRSDSSAITEVEWEAAKSKAVIPENVPIWLGMDVAWKWDTTAIVPLLREDQRHLLGPAVVLTPPRDGSMLDVERVKGALLAIHARNPIHTVVMDTSSAEDVAQWIDKEIGAEVIERGGNRTTDHVQDFERFMEGLRGGMLKHSGDPDLTKHAMNAIARVDRFGVARFDRPVPTRSGGPQQERRVIDALTAAAMVHAQALMVEPVSVYEERSLVEI